MLKNSIRVKNVNFLNNKDQFYSLLYHDIIHKGMIRKKTLEKIYELKNFLRLDIDCKNEKYAAQKTVSYGGSMATNKLRTTEYKIQDLKWKPISSNPGNVVRTAFENCY